MPEASKTPAQVERNFQAFQQQLPELLKVHPGKSVLMHDGEVKQAFDTFADAVRVGLETYHEYGNFSVHEVTDRVITLGIYSYASHVQERGGRPYA